MNRKLKQSLIKAYEKEMHFTDWLSEVKEGMSFSVRQKKPFPYRTLGPILGVTALTVCAIVICSVSLSSMGNGASKGTEASASFSIAEGMTNPGQEPNCFAFSFWGNYSLTFRFEEEDNILSLDFSENININRLCVFDGEEKLSYHSEGSYYSLERKESHSISWTYSENGKTEENSFLL